MHEQVHFNDIAFLAHERVGDLRSTAHELHGIPKSQEGTGHPGRVNRIRTTLGRRLVSLGSAVAGHHE